MIWIKNLTKAYGKKTIFKNLNLQIQEKITFITGPNGSGKTSLLKCLTNLEPYQGEIYYDNQSFHHVRKDIYTIYDHSPAYPHLTGYQNIELLMETPFNKEDIANLNIGATLLQPERLKKKVKTYSFGERKRLNIIMALLQQPKYLFLDEISNGLDHESLKNLRKILKKLSEVMTIIVIGHHFDDYASITDELILLREGTALKTKDFRQDGGDVQNEIFEYFNEHE